ncbi:ABC transporter substrate-binding protein [Natronomonas sp. EA1]|uniref:ABC transporter substrate-binding protein n=1 Tax=Natronomonas sp. EA1 TaxID=3421655 RepID=UPI003EBE7193
MSENDTKTNEAPTRREYVKYGGTVIGGGLLAGCAGQSDEESTPTETETDESTATESSTPEDQSYSVTISPIGSVEFDEVPEDVMAYSPHYADMLVGLGVGDRLNSLSFPDFLFTGFYDQLPGVSVDNDSLVRLFDEGMDKELLYELDSDVHLQDPTWIHNVGAFGLDESDTTEIATNVGPWFGNRYSRRNNYAGSMEYEYYSIWELTAKVGEAMRRRERAVELERVYDDLIGTIRPRLPTGDARPRVLFGELYDDTFYPTPFRRPGHEFGVFRDLRLRDAIPEDEYETYLKTDATFDYSGLLELDPDIIIQSRGIAYEQQRERSLQEYFYERLQSDPVASKVTAVENGRLYPGPTPFLGPVFRIFCAEMLAKQVYPDEFGRWRGVGDTPEDEQLFDRQRVADIINGNI